MRPIPLRADPAALVRGNVTALARVCIAKATTAIQSRPHAMATAILRQRWPDDPIAPLVLRAASPPASFATDPALGASVVADVISTIGPVGAGGRVLRSGLQLIFANHYTIYVPGLEATASAAAFVAEGAPIPVHDLVSNAVPLTPHKLSTIVALTSEMIANSNAEALVTDALIRSVGLALDGALLDSAAADPDRPAGLRHDIATSAASNDPNSDDAMIADIGTLAAVVAPIGEPIIFVAAPARAIAMQVRARRELPFAVFASPTLAADDLIAIAAPGLASAVATVPEIEASKVATVHMDDAPAPIVGGAPVVAAPVRDFLQADAVGIKIRFSVSWALRDARSLAWLTASGW